MTVARALPPRHRSGRRALGVLAVVVGAVAVAGCSTASGSTSGTAGSSETRYVSGDGTVTVVPADQRKPVPAVAGPGLQGGRVDLAGLRGKVVVLNVWASWCSPCRAEAPILQQVYAQTRDRGVAFVGINVRDSHDAALAFEKRFGVTYPSLDASRDTAVLLQFRGTLPLQAIPTTLVVDRQGRVAGRIVGEATLGKLTHLLDPLLAEPAKAGS